ncbi:DNA-binding protein [Candidatus Hydrogenedentota bacterium]
MSTCFDWEKYLKLSEDLQSATGFDQEAKARVVISRAYYAAFCKARNRLRDDEKIPIPNAEQHKFVRQKFIDTSAQNPNRYAIGNKLLTLSEERCKADYDDEFSGVAKSAKFALYMARKVLGSLGKL